MQRYSQRPFPPYQYTPGLNPHPTIDADGHSFAVAETETEFVASAWQDSDDYRFGIDLLNHGYYWEAHEVLEGIWHHLGRKSRDAQFIQALILLAVACLHKRRHKMSACSKVVHKGVQRLDVAAADYFGCTQIYLRRCFASLIEDPAFTSVTIELLITEP